MALKAILAKLEEAAEDVCSFYKKQDDKFVFVVDGMVTDEEHDALNAKVAEFRDSNIALKKENDSLKRSSTASTRRTQDAKRTRVAKIEAQGVKTDNIDAVIQAGRRKGDHAANPASSRPSRRSATTHRPSW
jgi:hypothetical protein